MRVHLDGEQRILWLGVELSDVQRAAPDLLKLMTELRALAARHNLNVDGILGQLVAFFMKAR